MVEQFGRSKVPKMVGGMFFMGAIYFFSYKKILETMPEKVKSFWLKHIQTSFYPKLLRFTVSTAILFVIYFIASLFYNLLRTPIIAKCNLFKPQTTNCYRQVAY